MTQILNVPMPADEAIKIIRSMFESNRMIDMTLVFSAIENYDDEDYSQSYSSLSDITTEWFKRTSMSKGITMIIKSISSVIPTYSVWQEVMILATGEIGEIIRQDRQYARDCYIAFVDEKIWRRWENYHRSEICKIA